jgi:hypothetical protein
MPHLPEEPIAFGMKPFKQPYKVSKSRQLRAVFTHGFSTLDRDSFSY